MSLFFDFFAAFQFLTRLPVPKALNKVSNDEIKIHLANSIFYFPLIGIILGLISGVLFLIFNNFWPLSLSIILVMTFEVLITGAFHEDAVADTCDGLGGGWKPEQIMEIMKDSRIGSYGTVGLILALSIKYFSLTGASDPFLAMLLASSISRWGILVLMYTSIPITGLSKDITSGCSLNKLLVSALYLGCILIFFTSFIRIVILMFGNVALMYLLARYFNRRLNGVSGDCLGFGCYICQLFIVLVQASNYGFVN